MNNYVNNSLQNFQGQIQQNPLQQEYIRQLMALNQNTAGMNYPQNTDITLQTAANQTHRCNLNLNEHLKYVDSLVLLKIIDKNTGESMKQNITAVFNSSKGLPAYSEGGLDLSQSEFLKARQCLLDYLLNAGIELNEAELKDIENIVLELEKNALLRGKNDENTLNALNKDNELAKERLITGSLRSSSVQKPPEKLFSRKEIAKMSTAEFIKNEPVINYQLQNGLL